MDDPTEDNSPSQSKSSFVAERIWSVRSIRGALDNDRSFEVKAKNPGRAVQ